MNQIEAYIRQRAAALGYDPDVVMNIVMHEGGVTDPVNRSRGYDPAVGGQEISYGPFQLNMNVGLGKNLLTKFGIDARDPANVYKGIDYALARAGVEGWTPWLNTMNKLGYGKWTGLGKGGSGAYDPANTTMQYTPGAANSPKRPADQFWPGSGQAELSARGNASPYSLHVRHPPNPTVGTMPTSDEVVAKADDKKRTGKQKFGDALADAVAGMGGKGGWQMPQIEPVPEAARVDAPVAPIWDTRQADANRQYLATVLAALNGRQQGSA